MATKGWRYSPAKWCVGRSDEPWLRGGDDMDGNCGKVFVHDTFGAESIVKITLRKKWNQPGYDSSGEIEAAVGTI